MVTHMSRAGIDALAPEDQATYLIGRISREAVELENALRSLYASFDGPDASPLGAPKMFSTTLSGCRKRLGDHADTTEEVQRLGSEALDEARSAYDERSRFTHDLLAESVNGMWSRIRLHRSEAEIVPHTDEVDRSAMEAAVLALIHATWRLRALALCLQPGGEYLDTWSHLLGTEFEVRWSGSAYWIG